MDKFDNNIHLKGNGSSIFSGLLALFLSLTGFIVIGPLIGALVALPFFEGSITDIPMAMSAPQNYPWMKTPVYIVQGVAAATGLILVPYLFFKIKEHQSISVFFSKKMPVAAIWLTAGITLTFMWVNSIFIYWNAEMVLPEFMSGFEQWAREKEAIATELTNFLTTFDTTSQFILAFVVVAIIPAFGEELLFRGLLQNYLHRGSTNIHLAVWLSAAIFSAIHFQFFGFIPRMLLGALFGYLYYWSGTLWVPVLAHFVNNAFSLVMVYLYQTETVTFDIQNTEAPPLSYVLIFAIITALLIFYFRKYFLNFNSNHERMAQGIQQ